MNLPYTAAFLHHSSQHGIARVWYNYTIMFPSPTKLLRLVLIISGAACTLAAGPMLMPLAWLGSCHQMLGLGSMPAAPIVEYLIRSVCGLYAMLGVIMIMTGQRLPQYRSMVLGLAGLWIGFGLAIACIDLSARLPHWWTWSESIATVAMGLTFFLLGRRLPLPGMTNDET